MKRNYEDKALRMARLSGYNSLQAGRCLICKLWKKPCPPCTARNGDGQPCNGLSAMEIAQRVLDGKQ